MALISKKRKKCAPQQQSAITFYIKKFQQKFFEKSQWYEIVTPVNNYAQAFTCDTLSRSSLNCNTIIHFFLLNLKYDTLKSKF